MKTCTLLALSFGILPGAAFAQTGAREVKVAGPTRLDWQFASQGFGAGPAKVPADYDSTKQRYQLYVPPVKKKAAWPLIVFISPGDKPAGLSAFKAVCDREGVLFCSPFAAGNTVLPGQRTRVVLDMLDDVRRKFPVDPDQTYLSGFSGGGRMACAIGFALPECFGGIAPVCGTNPVSRFAFLRHRAVDRLSLAFITGETDFNRKENEVYMQPWMEELGMRSKLWIVPKLAHQIPDSKVMAEVYAFLKADLKKRQDDGKSLPGLSFREDQDEAKNAAAFLAEGVKQVDDQKRTWRGIATLQFVSQRWPKSEAAAQARERLQQIVKDEAILQRVAEQGDKDEQLSLTAQAKAFERFGRIAQAIQAWELLAQSQPGTAAAKHAEREISRLKKK